MGYSYLWNQNQPNVPKKPKNLNRTRRQNQPSGSESFWAGFAHGNPWRSSSLKAEEWYDLNYLTSDQWLAKYPNKTLTDYRYWREKALKREQKTRDPNWLERVLIPQRLRQSLPGIVRAII